MKGLHYAIMWLTGRVLKVASSPSFSTGAHTLWIYMRFLIFYLLECVRSQGTAAATGRHAHQI